MERCSTATASTIHAFAESLSSAVRATDLGAPTYVPLPSLRKNDTGSEVVNLNFRLARYSSIWFDKRAGCASRFPDSSY